MATVLSAIITPAFQMLGQVGSGETPTTDEQSDALIALNAMLEGWKNDRLLAYAMQVESLTLANGTSSYTIGPSGDLNTTRPVVVMQAYILASNVSYDVRLISMAEYQAIQDKTTAGDWPSMAHYEPTMVTGTLYVYPVPNATRTMKLVTSVPVSAFAATSTTVALPPGWEEALAANLAVRLAPIFEREPSPTVMGLAMNTKRALKRMNTKPTRAYSDLSGLVGSAHVRNIISDSP